jgi:ankyrin repeat protein
MGNAQRDAIINAAKLGSTDELKAMLSKLSRDDKKAGRCYDEPGEGGQSALHKAAEYGWLPCVELLVDAGAQKQRLDEQGRTPLFVAADAGHAEVVEYLLKKGSDADYKFCSIPDGKMKKLDAEVTRETPLLRAAAKGNLEVVKKLCQGGADVNVRVIDSKLFFGTTALMQAAKNNRIGVVRYLVINAEAKVNAVNNDGSSALHLAAYAG